MNICLVGVGYVGLVTGVCLASRGHFVCCTDQNEKIVDRLNAGQATIFEPGLEDLLLSGLSSRRFSVTTRFDDALSSADIVVIAVGTPSIDGVIDLSQVERAVIQVAEYIRASGRFVAIVVKSTVTPGTTDTFVRGVLRRVLGSDADKVGLGMNPEFLREGAAVDDFMSPDRIVIGYEDTGTRSLLEELYSSWDVDKVKVTSRTAELIKYANNCLLATQVSAINEIANIAAAIGGIDIIDVVRGVHLDKRWNPLVGKARVNPGILNYLIPGCGFGGSCFPKDVSALRSHGRSIGVPTRILDAVLDVNEAQPAEVVRIIGEIVGDLQKRPVLILGLSFKPGTDDVRGSSAAVLAELLLRRGAIVSVHDPISIQNFLKSNPKFAQDIIPVERWEDECAKSSVLILVTPWDEYLRLRDIDLTGKIIFDARRALDKRELRGGRYCSVGFVGSAPPPPDCLPETSSGTV